MAGDLVPVGSKVPKETRDKLRWLAYMNDTTVSAIIAEYVAKCIVEEDFTAYQPSNVNSRFLKRNPRA